MVFSGEHVVVYEVSKVCFFVNQLVSRPIADGPACSHDVKVSFSRSRFSGSRTLPRIISIAVSGEKVAVCTVRDMYRKRGA